MVDAVKFWPGTLVDWAQIASAIGTCGAVIVSLWLAQRRPGVEVSVSASMRVLVYGDGRDEMPEFLAISVVNKGLQNVVIQSVAWKVRRRFWWGFRRLAAHQFVETTSAQWPNPRLPLALAHGESATFSLAAFGPNDWFQTPRERGFFSDVLRTRRSLGRLRVIAHTSVGAACVGRPDEAFLDRLWEVMQEHRKAQASGAH
jgi:hypothetical protein